MQLRCARCTALVQARLTKLLHFRYMTEGADAFNMHETVVGVRRSEKVVRVPRAALGINPSRSENHTTRPSSRLEVFCLFIHG